MHSETFAARAGRWSARHRRKAILGWLAFVVLAVVAGGMFGLQAPANDDSYIGESGRADRAYAEHFPEQTSESVLVQGRDEAAMRAAVDDLVERIGGQERVAGLQSPYAPGNEGQLADGGRAAVVTFDLVGTDEETEEAVEPVLEQVAAVQRAHPEVEVGQFGGASASTALSKAFSDDFKKAETISIPLTLLILVLAFGSFVAAGVPLLLGVTAVAATIGLLGPISQLVPMDDMISSVVLLVGMAVGVDYALFYLRRAREERRRGRSNAEAIEVAAATSGRAVLTAGLTVIAAMSGMLFAGERTFVQLGIGAMLVVAVAMIGSVTVVPALLAALGDKVDRGRIPLLGKRMERRRARRDGEAGAARTWVLDRVLRRPAIAAIGATALLLVLAWPATQLKLVTTGIDDLPRDLPVMQVYDDLQAAFPGGQIPATVVVEADDVTAAPVQAAVDDLAEQAVATGDVRRPVTVDVSPDRRVAVVSLPLAGDGSDATSVAAMERVRDELVPGTVGAVAGAQAWTSGYTAQSEDFASLMNARAPLIVGFVLALAFVLLLVTFRSIVVPVKAIVLNLLSVAAAYGVLVWVFQDGHGESLLGFTSNGGITAWLPMFLFVILFGLSMDYHVFILSRVREAVDRGMGTDEAVAHGIKATAATVTSAAVVMVAVFAIFATLSSLDFKQMGVGLAVAILIDATIVRAVLLPATMKLLGERNWYLPRKLEWLPRTAAHEA